MTTRAVEKQIRVIDLFNCQSNNTVNHVNPVCPGKIRMLHPYSSWPFNSSGLSMNLTLEIRSWEMVFGALPALMDSNP